MRQKHLVYNEDLMVPFINLCTTKLNFQSKLNKAHVTEFGMVTGVTKLNNHNSTGNREIKKKKKGKS